MTFSELKTLVDQKIAKLQKTMYEVFGVCVEDLKITYDLNATTTAGRAGYAPLYDNPYYMRLHPAALMEYGEDYINSTVVHEFAHLVRYRVFPEENCHHGDRWKMIMYTFGAVPNTTCDYDLEGAIEKHSETLAKEGLKLRKQRKQKTYTYTCGCFNHILSATKHNRIQSGKQRRRCALCKGELKLKGK